ncbi:MAG: dihydropteroate synthase, partial [Chloroflexi bacterium]|nr:dihydropteroate synthase [Chloroflexota bacterium]
MTDESAGGNIRDVPREGVVVAADPAAGGGAATPSFGLPSGATTGLPGPLGSTELGGRQFDWGTRTYVMGILNVTPDSFSGDGLLATAGDPVVAAVRLGREMAAEGADILDVGGESTRPGHEDVPADEEARRVVPVIAELRAALPDTPISIDTTKPAVAAAALDAGADIVNDTWGVAEDGRLAELAGERGVPVVLMHNRAEARYTNLLPEILADLQRAIERAVRLGVRWTDIVVDGDVHNSTRTEHFAKKFPERFFNVGIAESNM